MRGTTHAGNVGTWAGVQGTMAGVTAWLGRLPLALLQLLFRLALTSVFMQAGLTKLASWPLTVQLFADEYQVPVLPPELAAVCATTIELACSSLLLVGLGTRLATLPLLGMLLTIQLCVYPHAYAEHLTWGALLLFLRTRGPGAFALDPLLGWAPARECPE